MARIILIDEPGDQRRALAQILEREGHAVAVGRFADAGCELRPGRFELALLGIAALTDSDALDLVVRRRGCREPVVLIAEPPDLPAASAAVRTGTAFDYLVRPVAGTALLETAARALRFAHLLRERDRAVALHEGPRAKAADAPPSTSATAMARLCSAVREVGRELTAATGAPDGLARDVARIERRLRQARMLAAPLRLDLQPAQWFPLVSFVPDGPTQAALGVMDQHLTMRGGLGIAVMDARLIEEALANLLRNAGEACSGRGCMELSAHADAVRVVIEIRDDGPGVAEDRRRDVFLPFHGAGEQATGMGLASPVASSRLTAVTSTWSSATATAPASASNCRACRPTTGFRQLQRDRTAPPHHTSHRPAMPESTDRGRYPLTAAPIAAFARDGWVHLPGLLARAEVEELSRHYMALLRREVPVRGRDYCDMSGDYQRPIEQFAVLNVMLPRVYLPALQGNVYERRAADVARQLCGDDMMLDYDQMVAKPPRKPDGVFHWHQDLAYWPETRDTRTASFWLAMDLVDLDNGGPQFVQGSHREPALRPHLPLHGDREKSHVMAARIDERKDVLRNARLQPGDATVHHERTVHGSGGNTSDRWRRGYVVAFRSRETVAAERAMGFTHSHNDDQAVLAAIARARGR